MRDPGRSDLTDGSVIVLYPNDEQPSPESTALCIDTRVQCGRSGAHMPPAHGLVLDGSCGYFEAAGLRNVAEWDVHVALVTAGRVASRLERTVDVDTIALRDAQRDSSSETQQPLSVRPGDARCTWSQTTHGPPWDWSAMERSSRRITSERTDP